LKWGGREKKGRGSPLTVTLSTCPAGNVCSSAVLAGKKRGEEGRPSTRTERRTGTCMGKQKPVVWSLRGEGGTATSKREGIVFYPFDPVLFPKDGKGRRFIREKNSYQNGSQPPPGFFSS